MNCHKKMLKQKEKPEKYHVTEMDVSSYWLWAFNVRTYLTEI